LSSDVEKRLKALDIGRFQVMALLQTARYYRLHGDLMRAKSFADLLPALKGEGSLRS
jgi:hypothetical protein